MKKLIFILLLSSCTVSDPIQVEEVSIELIRIDTFSLGGKIKPAAIWRSNNKIEYVDYSKEFPYPYKVGDWRTNFMTR